ncbi:hypothetical protein EYF80_012805 [Liparis tanakae]|uniref:Uncharacterized protein n=1 Tax=Liparis tanakae TaxID=230148 RepID=A0A4Z2IG23_9TELE|nr:hypothetical protein EYF80_012805 [Liparis tanakae]
MHIPPKTNKVSDTDQAPVCAPDPAFVRPPRHSANCDQEAASLITRRDKQSAATPVGPTMDSTSYSDCGVGRVGEWIQMENMGIGNADDEQNALEQALMFQGRGIFFTQRFMKAGAMQHPGDLPASPCILTRTWPRSRENITQKTTRMHSHEAKSHEQSSAEQVWMLADRGLRGRGVLPGGEAAARFSRQEANSGVGLLGHDK